MCCVLLASPQWLSENSAVFFAGEDGEQGGMWIVCFGFDEKQEAFICNDNTYGIILFPLEVLGD